MKLYYHPGACSLAPHIVARELELDIALVHVDVRRHTWGDGFDFRDINALGYVPVLETDDGETLVEGPVILQYLADRKPEAGLASPAGTMARYRLQEWLNFLTSEIHKGFIPLLYPVAAGKYVDTVRPKLYSRFAWVDERLGATRYLLGDDFSVADAYLFALTGWGKADWLTSVYGADIELSALANLRRWYRQVRERPAVIAARRAEGLVDA